MSISKVANKSASGQGRRRHRRVGFESLEDRRLLASDIQHLYGVVHDIASTYISCPATCDDVVQDTVIKIVDRWDVVEPLAEASQNAYVAKATKNTFVDWVRADVRKTKLVEKVFTNEKANISGYSPEEPIAQLIAEETRTHMERWLDDQSGPDREILRLRQAGMTMDRIADQLEIPKSTVQFRCQRMMEACFRELGLERE